MQNEKKMNFFFILEGMFFRIKSCSGDERENEELEKKRKKNSNGF